MPGYEDFAETYQHWAETDNSYRVIELYSFFTVLGPVKDLDILDLASGEGRTARMLAHNGARSVLGSDASPEMVRRAKEQGALAVSDGGRREGLAGPQPRFIVLDAADQAFQLDKPVDLVTAMYLFHYAPTEQALRQMADLIGRNLKPGGRLVTYTISPDYDFSRPETLLMKRCGFDYSLLDGNHCTLNIADERVDMWQWSRSAHEKCLAGAGLKDIRWHPLQAPPDAADVAKYMKFYLDNPSCIVLSATKA